MPESYPKLSDLEGKAVCFLLDVIYQGSPRRFSTFPIDITDPADSTTLRYYGGLNDPEITESTEFVGFDLEANVVPMELIFYDVDWVSEWSKGRLIDDSECTISMITVEDGQTSFTQQSKVVLFKGKAIGGIFGVPDKPAGFISFSIENDITIESPKIIPDYAYLENIEFPVLWVAAEGKVIPWVFGQAGPYPRPTSSAFDFLGNGPGSPTYAVLYSATIEVEFLVAYDLTQGGNLRIWDSKGGNFVNPIEVGTDSDGNVYSYVSYDYGTEIENNNFDASGDESITYWADWSENDGAISSPYSNGVLEGAGDICLFCLDKSGLEYDEPEWEGMRLFLNRYKFGGYVNDTDATWWGWLKEAIIPYLPIEVVNGGNGIKPILNSYFYFQDVEPNHVIEDSGDFEIITGLQPLEVDPVNKIKVFYAPNKMQNKYQASYNIDPEISEAKQRVNRLRHPLSDISYQRYGLRELTINLDHCYDLDTAIRIAEDTLRIRAMGAYGFDASAAPRYGYIMLGDILSISSTRLGLTDWKCQVIAKRWEQNRWIFTIYIENNNFINLAQI